MGFDEDDMEEVTVGSFSGLVLEASDGSAQEYTLNVVSHAAAQTLN